MENKLPVPQASQIIHECRDEFDLSSSEMIELSLEYGWALNNLRFNIPSERVLLERALASALRKTNILVEYKGKLKLTSRALSKSIARGELPGKIVSRALERKELT